MDYVIGARWNGGRITIAAPSIPETEAGREVSSRAAAASCTSALRTAAFTLYRSFRLSPSRNPGLFLPNIFHLLLAIFPYGVSCLFHPFRSSAPFSMHSVPSTPGCGLVRGDPTRILHHDSSRLPSYLEAGTPFVPLEFSVASWIFSPRTCHVPIFVPAPLCFLSNLVSLSSTLLPLYPIFSSIFSYNHAQLRMTSSCFLDSTSITGQKPTPWFDPRFPFQLFHAFRLPTLTDVARNRGHWVFGVTSRARVLRQWQVCILATVVASRFYATKSNVRADSSIFFQAFLADLFLIHAFRGTTTAEVAAPTKIPLSRWPFSSSCFWRPCSFTPANDKRWINIQATSSFSIFIPILRYLNILSHLFAASRTWWMLKTWHRCIYEQPLYELLLPLEHSRCLWLTRIGEAPFAGNSSCIIVVRREPCLLSTWISVWETRALSRIPLAVLFAINSPKNPSTLSYYVIQHKISFGKISYYTSAIRTIHPDSPQS